MFQTRALKILAGAGLAVFLCGGSPILAATKPSLGAAETFSVLAGLSMSAAAGGTTVSGDLGLSPGLAVSRTGPWTVGGSQYFGPSSLAFTAQAGALAAFNNLAGQGSNGTWGVNPWSPVPGVWTVASDVTFTGTITLAGGYNDVWVFQVGRDMTFSGSVVLTGNAQACNVFWQIGRSATIASGSAFVGTLIASTDITLVSGASVNGRLLSLNGALTTDTNAISGPVCATAPVTSALTLGAVFGPTTIATGGVSTKTFTLTNASAATAATNVGFTDTYPAGLTNSSTAVIVNTCGGTVLGGTAGGNTIGLSGVTIPAGSSCTISVGVTASLVNCYTNISGAITSNEGTGNSASATLCVTARANTAVPTLSGPAMIMLAALLALSGFVAIRRLAT